MPSRTVRVGVSNRHAHLTPEHSDILFGPGRRLTPLRPLLQPDQFASKETITIATAQGVIPNVRLIGPERKYTQVEISRTDAFLLGLDPPIRQSGNLEGSPGCVLIGPAGSVIIDHGVILAGRHLHCHTSEAAVLGLRDRQIIRARFGGERGGVMENLLVRVGDIHKLELHIDTDEANAFGLKTGDTAELVY
ncbi:MAG: phosphate propanoyltransferase [Candidatus Hydrogenedentota bacterium]|nr:MAG: phosphate propanoyltransferase [Candidatus Hydrogenedentota bacterium]